MFHDEINIGVESLREDRRCQFGEKQKKENKKITKNLDRKLNDILPTVKNGRQYFEYKALCRLKR